MKDFAKVFIETDGNIARKKKLWSWNNVLLLETNARSLLSLNERSKVRAGIWIQIFFGLLYSFAEIYLYVKV